MKKRVLSILLAAQMMMGMFMEVCVSAEEKLYYTQADLSNNFDSIAFLSESVTGEYNSPNFFMESNAGKNVSAPFAVDKNDFDEKYPNGILTTADGVPYQIQSNDGTAGAARTGKNGNGLTFDANYYSQIKLLAIRPTTNITGGGTHDYIACTIFAGGNNTGDIYLNNGSTPNKSVGTVKYIKVFENEEIESGANTNLTEHTLKLNDTMKSKKTDQIKFYYIGRNTTRFIAATLVQTDSDVKKYIDEKVAQILASETPSVDKVISIRDYMEEKAEQGFNLDTVTGIDEFRKLEKKYVYLKDYNEETDYENIKLNINFTTAISQDSVSTENFAVTSSNEEKAFTVEEIKTDDKITGVTLIMENTQDYADEIKVVVSKNIKNAEDENFTLGSDKTITFKPTVPTVYIKALNKTVSGENTVITGEIKNNSDEEQAYVLILGVYSEDNEMTSRAIISGKAQANETITINKTLTSTGSIAEGTLLTNLTDLKILNCVSAK